MHYNVNSQWTSPCNHKTQSLSDNVIYVSVTQVDPSLVFSGPLTLEVVLRGIEPTHHRVTQSHGSRRELGLNCLGSEDRLICG